MNDKLPPCPKCGGEMMFKRNMHWKDPFLYCKNLDCELANIGTRKSEVNHVRQECNGSRPV